MAANSGPKIVRTGLIAFYDPGSEKSFRGIATTNLMYGINNAYSPANDGTFFKTSYGTESAFIPYFNQNINVKYVDIYNDYNGGSNNCCPAPFSYHSSPIVVSGNTTYMYQIIYKTDTGYSSANYMYRYEYNSSSTLTTQGGVLDVSRTESLGDGWIHAWGSFTTNVNTTSLYGYLFHYEYNTWNRIRVAAVSLTQGSLVHRPEHLINLNFRASRGNTTGSGGGLKDLIGSNDAELINGVSHNGSFGGSLVFDGVNDYCRFTLPSSSTISVSAWVRSSSWSTQTHPMIIAKGINVEWILWKSDDVGQDEKFAWRSGDSSTVYSTTTAQNNIWYHLVATVGPDGMKLYVNGTVESSNAVSTVPLGSVDPCIGCGLSSNNPSNFLLGNVTLVKIWNRQITAAEVLTNYKSTRSRFTQTTNRNIITSRTSVAPTSTNSLFASTILYIDPSNRQSYSPGSQIIYDLSSSKRTGIMYTNGGASHYLVAHSAIPLSTDGKGTLQFDGTNDWIRLTSSLYLFSDATVSAWIKTSVSGSKGIISHCSGGPVSVEYSIQTNMSYRYWSGPSNTIYSYVAVNDGLWKNVVWVKTSTNMKMYVNGILDREFTLVSNPTAHLRAIGTNYGPCMSNNGIPGTVAYGPGTDYYSSVFNGLMGPMIIWSRALAASEVVQSYNNFKTRFGHSSIITSGLVLHLNASDRASYSGTGTTWTDLSGNGNNFTLYNGASFSTERGGCIAFDGINDYAASTNNLNLTSYSYVAIEIVYKSNNTNTAPMLFEHTSNWNSFTGGFGLAINTNGTSNVANLNHTNHNTEVARNYEVTNNLLWNNNFNLFSRISDSTGRVVYSNSNLISFSSISGYGTTTVTTAGGSFSNDIFYLGSRGGASGFFNGSIASIKIYVYKISQSEVLQNFNAERWRFGI